MKVLILEDEIPAYEKLLGYLKHHFDGATEFDWSRTLKDAKQLLTQTAKYDIIFSDIELLDGRSIDLFNEVKITCPIIFCTAYNEHLLAAFKNNGIAYILKPYSKEDLDQALNKYDTFFTHKTSIEIDSSILHKVSSVLSQSGSYKSRFIIKTSKRMYLLPTSEISYVEATGAFCKLIDTKGATHLFSQSISQINDALNPKYFFKINRSQIVNIDHIVDIENYFKNRLSLSMKGSKERITTSSSTTAKFRLWLGS